MPILNERNTLSTYKMRTRPPPPLIIGIFVSLPCARVHYRYTVFYFCDSKNNVGIAVQRGIK